jgi:PKD repeat protein
MKKQSSIDTGSHLLIAVFLSACVFGNKLNAQLSYKVLFLGNSYTGVNNLPQLVHDVALSAGDTLVFDSYSPGGYQLIDHSVDAASQNKIMAQSWDYVVMQGQSQEPVTMHNQFVNGGTALYNFIKQQHPCTVPMLYMTWGRKDGDPSSCGNFPVTCTYQGMDSAIRVSYLSLAALLNAEVSPVSVVWKYLRQNFPNLELYQADESHPSLAGSYAAACCFYTALFKKNPVPVTYNPGLTSTDAANIRNAVKLQVFDSLQRWNFRKLPVSKFNYQVGAGANQVIFNPVNQGVKQAYSWNFGDATTSAVLNPIHSYSANGTFTVSLTTSNCDIQGTHTSFSDTVLQFCSHTPTIFTSNAWLCNYDTLWTQAADTYQWLENGTLLPETNRYLPDYSRYNISGFSVISTVNGCSELSQVFSGTPEWSGYYFDVMGDPCAGDSVFFAVLHTNGSLSGNEKIQWYKNNILLPMMTNEDTLLITGSGKYECKVVNPNSKCPFDTTAYTIKYDCVGLGVTMLGTKTMWKLFPNPASGIVNVLFAASWERERVEIYCATGQLVRAVEVTGSVIRVSGLPAGLYFVRLRGHGESLKLIIE